MKVHLAYDEVETEGYENTPTGKVLKAGEYEASIVKTIHDATVLSIEGFEVLFLPNGPNPLTFYPAMACVTRVPLKHVKLRHIDCDNPHCNVCNLYVCATCGGAEGSLTTACPGVQMSWDQTSGVYHGSLDFKDGRWVAGDGDMPCANNQILLED